LFITREKRWLKEEKKLKRKKQKKQKEEEEEDSFAFLKTPFLH
tara:strand:+ start:228 stop:356 length:129 start_codon:yes stop_codon:yes gene_type:complete